MIMHEASLAAPVDRPARRQLRECFDGRASLGVDYAAGGDERERALQRLAEQRRIERRIEEHDIEATGGQACRETHRVGLGDLDGARAELVLDRLQLPGRAR